MSASLPDGARLFLATGYNPSKPVSGITNANPGVISAAAHGMANGALFELKSGWQKLNDRIFRAAGISSGTVNADTIDTTSTVDYPVGSSSGSLKEISALTQITQVLQFGTTGGDQQFATFSYLEEDFERQLPTVTSAQSITIGIADDPTLAGYLALKAASEKRVNVALQLLLKSGSFILYNGIVSLNETPSLNKGNVMQITSTFSLQSKPVRYNS